MAQSPKGDHNFFIRTSMRKPSALFSKLSLPLCHRSKITLPSKNSDCKLVSHKSLLNIRHESETRAADST